MSDLTLAALLDEEELYFEPTAGVYDLDAIAAHIATIGFAARDVADPEMVMIVDTAEGRDAALARRKAHPADGFPFVLLVRLTPGRITVSPVNDGDLATLSAGLLAWLAAVQPCRVLNDSQTDVTAAVLAG